MFLKCIKNSFSSIHRVQCNSIRLDKFLWQSIGGTYSNSQKLVREGYIKFNGVKLKDFKYKLQQGDQIELFVDRVYPNNEKSAFQFSLDYQEELTDKQASMDYFRGMLVYEDSNYFVLNKDYGVSAQGGKDRDKNLPNLMSNYLIESGQTQSVFRVVHRLDRPVSGLMFAAKNSNAAKEFSYLLEKRLNLTKQYICVVSGVPVEKQGTIKAPLTFNMSKQKAQLSNYSEEDHKECITEYEVLFSTQSHSILRVTLIDGRKHQIRVHLSKVLNTPIVFDGLYGYNYQLQSSRELQTLVQCPDNIKPILNLNIRFNTNGISQQGEWVDYAVQKQNYILGSISIANGKCIQTFGV